MQFPTFCGVLHGEPTAELPPSQSPLPGLAVERRSLLVRDADGVCVQFIATTEQLEQLAEAINEALAADRLAATP